MSQLTSHPVEGEADARHAVENVLAAYCAAVDDRDSVKLRDLLTNTRVTFRGAPVDGDIGEFYERVFATSPTTRHLFSNLTVNARAAADLVHYRATYQRWELDNGRPECVALGRYDGAFRVTSNGTTRTWAWMTHTVTTDNGGV